MIERSFIPPPHYVLVPLLEGQLINTPSASLVTLMRDSYWADTPWRVPTGGCLEVIITGVKTCLRCGARRKRTFNYELSNSQLL